MDRLQELLDKRGKLQAQIEAILKEADEGDGRLTDEQVTQIEDIENQIGTLDGDIEAEKKQADIRRRAEERREAIAKDKRHNRKARPEGELSVTQVGNPRENFLDDPKRGFASPREFLLGVMEAGRNQGTEDGRLLSLVAPGGRKAAVGSDEHSTVSDPYGGFLLPTGFSPELLSRDNEGDPTMGRTTMVPMQYAQVKIPARVDSNHTNSVSGGLRVYRTNETDTASSSRMEFEQVVLEANELMGISYASEQLLQRSPMSFIALLEAGFNDEFSTKRLKEKLFGTGAGEYEGVVNAAATVSVAKESGQAAATIVKENLDKMMSRQWRYGRSIWLYNHDCLPQLMSLVQTIGTGGQRVPYFNVDSNGNGTILGRPAFATEFCETLGTLGDVINADWSQYLEGTLTSLQSDESIHVRFVNNERTFKFWEENDGRPWWRAALTPNQSSNTLSPFVTLAARA